MVAHDQVFRTKDYERTILICSPDDRCHIYKDGRETIDHLMSACFILAKKGVNRLDYVCTCEAFSVRQRSNSAIAQIKGD